MVPWCLGRPSPDPRLGSEIELGGRHTASLLNLLRIGKALPSKGIAAEEPPPALLEIEPARSGGNEDLVQARMLFEPSARLQAVVTTEIIGDDEDVAFGIVGFDVGEQGDVPFGVARSGASGHFLAIAHPQCPVDPGFLGATLIVQRRFDAVPIRRPARSGVKGTRHYWSELIGADGRRALGRFGVMAHDRRSFGTKSLSRGVPQLCVCRHRTPSRKRMVRI